MLNKSITFFRGHKNFNSFLGKKGDCKMMIIKALLNNITIKHLFFIAKTAIIHKKMVLNIYTSSDEFTQSK